MAGTKESAQVVVAEGVLDDARAARTRRLIEREGVAASAKRLLVATGTLARAAAKLPVHRGTLSLLCATIDALDAPATPPPDPDAVLASVRRWAASARISAGERARLLAELDQAIAATAAAPVSAFVRVRGVAPDHAAALSVRPEGTARESGDRTE